ncbi:MAG: ABC transporter permease [Peptococcaceae bacterium]|nr:ABC transporter permease [Peptococcaceae bacterium]
MKYAVTRLLQLIPLLFVLTLVVFILMRLIPGDPVTIMLGHGAPPDAVAVERVRLGLDQPFYAQYLLFLKNLLKGDMGVSLSTGNTVASELVRRFPYTLTLALGGTVVAAVLGMMAGVVAAVHHNKSIDNTIVTVSMLAISTPSFFLALLLMLLFTFLLGWLPSIGLTSWKHAILPVITLGLSGMGLVTRTTRSSMLDVLSQDYVRTSRSSGIPEKITIYSHALKNALIPVITVLGLRFGYLLAGATLVETVFSIPGIGRFMVDGVLKRDYPVVQSTILVFAASFVTINTAVDLLYAFVDPRIKYE